MIVRNGTGAGTRSPKPAATPWECNCGNHNAGYLAACYRCMTRRSLDPADDLAEEDDFWWNETDAGVHRGYGG